MSKIEQLMDAYMHALTMQICTAGSKACQSLKDDINQKVIDTRKAVIDYTNGLENVLLGVVKSIDNAIDTLEESEEFTPRDFNMIEEQNNIIDEINREGFETF